MAQRLATEAEVRALAPELESTSVYPSAMITTWSRIAGSQIGLVAWGEEASDGHALLTAHYVVRSVLGGLGPNGPATSLSAGEISSSFASVAPDEDLRSTFYGSAYAELRRHVVARAGTLLVANSRISQ